MATSGRMQGNSINLGGGPCYIFVDWQLTSQNGTSNSSNINWQAYAHFTSSDAQLDNGYASLGGATRWSNGGRIKNFTGTYTTRDIALGSGSFTVYHDGSGNYTLPVSASIVYYNGNVSSGSASWALPNIPRYANITAFNQSSTDVSIGAYISTDVTCDLLQFSLDGAGWETYTSGGFTSQSATLGGNLSSGVVHTLKARVRRADSGLWTETGTANVTTKSQNNFIEFM